MFYRARVKKLDWSNNLRQNVSPAQRCSNFAKANHIGCL